MGEWKEYRLGDVSISINEKIDTSILDNSSYISTENMRPNKSGITISSSIPSGYAIKYCKDDILISNIRPYFKKIWRANKEGGCSMDIICLRAKNIIDPQYLYYHLSQDEFFDYVMQGSKGTKMPRGDRSQIMRWPIFLPSKEEQKRIASILKSLDDKIENNKRINENLEQQAQALFKSWFVDFEPFRDQPFVDSELGMIPEGWRVGYFIDNINIMPGGTPSTNVSEYWDNGDIPFFSPKDVNGVYCLNTEKAITLEGLKHCSSQLYPKDTIIVTARGTVGKIVLAGVPMAMNQSNYALVPKEGISNYYLYLQSQTLVDILLKKANGAVFSAITTKDFKEHVVIPPLNIINKFDTIIRPIFDKIHLIMRESLRLAQLRDTLLPKLMSGEIKL